MQPFDGPNIGAPFAVMLTLLFVAFFFLAVTRPNRIVIRDTIELRVPEASEAAGDWTPDPADPARVYFSKPFELTGSHNVRISAAIDGANTWTHINGDLVNESSGALQSFELPIEYYEGVSEGESWSEGSPNRSAYLSPPPKGRYLVRLEPHWPTTNAPSSVRVEVREGVMRIWHFVVALLLLLLPAIMALIHRLHFETQRWKDSEFNPYAGTSDSDDE
jgi:hypothetical protein